MTCFTLLLGGDLTPTAAVRRLVDGTRVIAADGGMQHAVALGIVPELWVGDFDSVPEGLPTELLAVPRQGFPRDKAKTDGELAADIAIEQGATELILVGAFGGPRSDHEFLHLALGLRLAEMGFDVVLTSGNQEGHPLPHGDKAFGYPDGTLFSVVAFSDLHGLSLTGAKWPLDTIVMPFGSSLTISNETRGGLKASLRSGRAMLIAHPAIEPRA